jgi:hypothetical protein
MNMTEQHRERPYIYKRRSYENKKSLSTGEPANSGLSNMQLKIDMRSVAFDSAGNGGLLQKVRQAHSASFQKPRAKASYSKSISDDVGTGKWGGVLYGWAWRVVGR